MSTYNVIAQNVGIGTSNPSGKLHIAGVDGNSTVLSIKVENPSDSSLSGIHLINNLATANFYRNGNSAIGNIFGVPVAQMARI